MKLKFYFLFLILAINNNSSFSQCNYRIKAIKTQHDSVTTYFLLPPKSKIAKEGFIFHKKGPLTFEVDSRFRYQYVIIRGIGQDYATSKEAVSNAAYKRSGSKNLSNKLAKYVVNTPIVLDNNGIVKYYISSDPAGNSVNIIFQIDYDQLLNDVSNFKKYYFDLFIKISALNDAHNWGGQDGNIGPEIVKKIFELTPIPQDQSLGRYMAMIDDNKTFLLLDPQIWLQVDNAEKIKPKMPYSDSSGLIKDNNNFWSYNLYGQTLIKFYRNERGMLMQYPLLKFSGNITLSPNNLNIFNADHSLESLQASTADIQFTENIKKEKFIYLFQSDFKHNNSNATPTSKSDNNNFFEKNSQLLFNDKIDQDFINTIDKLNPTPHADLRTVYSVFGMRNLINAVIPLVINDVSTPVNLYSTIQINKDQGIIPYIKKIRLYRIYRNTYKRIKLYKNDLLLLPNDKITY